MDMEFLLSLQTRDEMHDRERLHDAPASISISGLSQTICVSTTSLTIC